MDPLEVKTETVGNWRELGRNAQRLHVFQGGTLLSYPLLGSMTLRLGRASGADIMLDDPGVSRLHLQIDVEAPAGDNKLARVTLTDLGSANGTRVNGALLTPQTPFPLAPGVIVEIGRHTRLLLVLEQQPEERAEAQAAPLQRGIVVEDPALREIHALLRQIAPSDLNVLLLGETGVGKEILAAEVHRLSGRKGALVPVNCSAIPDHLLESELFGHEKGAFTGALTTKRGLFEAAAGGTVFLDEVGETPLQVQAKLLRVLEDRVVRRVGGVEGRALDVRFVSATNSNIDEVSESGAFRRDLYYRLNGISIVIPPLRERRREIMPLARHFATAAAARAGRGPPQFSTDATEALRAHAWPGNIRELRNTIERATVLAGAAPIRREDLGLPQPRPAALVSEPPRPPAVPSMEKTPLPPPSQPSSSEPVSRPAADAATFIEGAITAPGPGSAPPRPRADPGAQTTRVSRLSEAEAAAIAAAGAGGAGAAGAAGPNAAGAGGPRLWDELKQIEKQRIVAALEECAGNQTRAAAALGISRKMLLARLDEHGIARPRKRAKSPDAEVTAPNAVARGEAEDDDDES